MFNWSKPVGTSEEMLSIHDKKQIDNYGKQLEAAMGRVVDLVNDLQDKCKEEKIKFADVFDALKGNKIEVLGPEWKTLTNIFLKYTVLHDINHQNNNNFKKYIEQFKEVDENHQRFSDIVRKLLAISINFNKENNV